MTFRQTIGLRTHLFRDLKDLMAKATPLRSGDQLAALPRPPPRKWSRRGWRSPTSR